MYVHVTDKEKDSGKRNLIATWVNFYAMTASIIHSESSVNIVFLGKYQQTAVHKYELEGVHRTLTPRLMLCARLEPGSGSGTRLS